MTLTCCQLRDIRKSLLRIGKEVALKGRSVTSQELREIDFSLSPSMQGSALATETVSSLHMHETRTSSLIHDVTLLVLRGYTLTVILTPSVIVVVDNVGECMFNFVMAYGSWKNSKALYQLLVRHEGEPLPQEQVSSIFDEEEQSFYNWTITTLNHATGDDVKHNMFERTVITHRRGLTRSGREMLAQQGLLMKKSLYDSTLVTKFRELGQRTR